jgi:hypothetical protein
MLPEYMNAQLHLAMLQVEGTSLQLKRGMIPDEEWLQEHTHWQKRLSTVRDLVLDITKRTLGK